MHGGEVEERKKSWNELDRVVGRISNGYRLCVLRDLNGLDGDRMREGITGG